MGDRDTSADSYQFIQSEAVMCRSCPRENRSLTQRYTLGPSYYMVELFSLRSFLLNPSITDTFKRSFSLFLILGSVKYGYFSDISANGDE